MCSDKHYCEIFNFENVQMEGTANLLFPEIYSEFSATFEWLGLTIVRNQGIWQPSTTSSFETKF